MSDQQPLDFAAARAARDAGIQTAVDHADTVVPRWSELAYAFLESYLPHVEFLTSEDARKAAAGIVPDPPSLRAWGGPFAKAARNGLVQREGYDRARDPKVHMNVVTVWRSRLYRGVA